MVVLNAGQIEQIGTPDEVYEQPATPFVYHFLGDVNLFHGRVHAGRASIGEIEVTLGDHQDAHDAPALVYVRPHDIEVDRKPNGEGGIEAIVRDVRQLGATVRLELERRDGGGLVEAQMSRDRYRNYELQSGEQVFIRPQNLRIYFKEGESTDCAKPV